MEKRPTPSIVDRLLEVAVAGDLQPGDPLPTERVLAEQLGVSRNLIRQGFSVLEERGIVVSRRGAGRYLRQLVGGVGWNRSMPRLEISSIADVLEARILLEEQVVVLACQRRTRDEADALLAAAGRLESWEDNVEFHVALASATHNFMLERLVHEQANLLGELHQRTHYDDPKELRRMRAEHHEIAAAVAARDQDTARSLLHDHLERTRRVVTHSPGRRARRTTAS